jgi:GSH-dependent disulfide-bond oxidoreductase
MKPIELYTYRTPNGHKASIMLAETGLPYEVYVVDIEKGDQHRPEFLALNPNNKIPVIVDPDCDRTVFESGAILFYLADRSGVLKPEGADETGRTLQWILFQAAHVGPMIGQLWHFKVFATGSCHPPSTAMSARPRASSACSTPSSRSARISSAIATALWTS